MEVLLGEFVGCSSKSCRSEWPHGLRHELSSLARTLGSWVRIPVEAWMSVFAFILCVLCIGRDLATADPLSKGSYRPCIGLRN
jgi:hypothetical protein